MNTFLAIFSTYFSILLFYCMIKIRLCNVISLGKNCSMSISRSLHRIKMRLNVIFRCKMLWLVSPQIGKSTSSYQG